MPTKNLDIDTFVNAAIESLDRYRNSIVGTKETLEENE
jgi:hypothetical protein